MRLDEASARSSVYGRLSLGPVLGAGRKENDGHGCPQSCGQHLGFLQQALSPALGGQSPPRRLRRSFREKPQEVNARVTPQRAWNSSLGASLPLQRGRPPCSILGNVCLSLEESLKKPVMDIVQAVVYKHVMTAGLVDSSFRREILNNWQPASHICPWMGLVWQARVYIFKKISSNIYKVDGFTQESKVQFPWRNGQQGLRWEKTPSGGEPHRALGVRMSK